MDKDKIVEKVAESLNVDHKTMSTLYQRQDEDKILDVLEAAGYFEICEAAKNLCREPISTYDMENMYEVLKKAGVWDE